MLPDPIARLLARRGISPASGFLHPDPAMLSPWRDLPGLEPIVDRLLACAGSRCRILVWGDYDADGLTSAAIMHAALVSLGAEVRTQIPERLTEGYGLGSSVIELCRLVEPQVLLAVDCGSTAVEEIAALHEMGVEVLVLDHHEPGGRIPRDCLIANPWVASTGESWKTLSAAGVCHAAFRGLAELSGSLDHLAGHSLGLAAVGTICDIVPLRLDSRTLASCGLAELSRGAVPGISALCESSGIVGSRLGSEDISYRIGPRLNACGRVGSVSEALDLLTASSREGLEERCARIEEMNRTRKVLDRRVSEEASSMARSLGARRGLLLARKGWHRGVLGIAASRLSSELGIPVALAAVEEDGVARGSARSVPGVPLHEVLGAMSDVLLSGGGHSQAAGLSFRASDLEVVAGRFEDEVAVYAPVPAGHVLYLDGRLGEEDLTPGLARSLLDLEPFGEGNEEPVWITSGAALDGFRRMGGGRHMSCTATIGASSVRAVGFGMGGLVDDHAPGRYDLAFSLRLDTWRGPDSIALHLRDLRPSR